MMNGHEAPGSAASLLDGATAERLLAAMRGRRVVVVGDVCLDEYLIGTVERVSREGPVPVLAYRQRLALPGGAANPARNLAALGATVCQVAVVGADAPAAELRELLASCGIDAGGLIVDPTRPTTLKTRVVAEGLTAPQQVARIDRQDRRPITGEVETAVGAAVARAAARADALLVSHYRSGVVTPAVAAAARATAAGRWLTVDAQGDVERFAGYRLVRLGRQDASTSLGRALDSEDDYRQATEELRRRLGAEVVIVGRGASGTSLADEAGYTTLAPANVSEVFDVSGAGDTVIATVTLALAAGAAVREAVALANLAAGIVVRRLGVAAPLPEEILEELRRIAGGER
jgi:rfaE bifunctional protein kinase chain/domain